MAKCKYCHEVISRLDKDVCPFCGGIKPLEGTDTSTQDVTKVIDQLDNKVEIKHKKRIIAAILCLLFGLFGLHQFYLGKNKKGLITLGVSVSFILILGLILFFAVGWKTPFAFLVPYFAVEAVMIDLATVYIKNHSIQDANGEFLE